MGHKKQSQSAHNKTTGKYIKQKLRTEENKKKTIERNSARKNKQIQQVIEGE